MTGSPRDEVAAKLAAGLVDLQPLLDRSGFARVDDERGKGSGGPFAGVTFGKGDRTLHLWLRGDSLSVRYRVGDQQLDHATFMRELLGPGGPNRFPAYADDVAQAFAALRHDLEHFCGDFLDGDAGDFRRCAVAVEKDDQLSGAQRLTRIEQQLTRR